MTGDRPPAHASDRDQSQHDTSWNQPKEQRGWNEDSWHGSSKHWSSRNESGWHNGGWNQGWHESRNYNSGSYAASTEKNWGRYNRQDYSSTKRQQRDSRSRPPRNREDYFEERNTKRRERHEANEPSRPSEFQEFIDGAKEEEEGERLRRAKPIRPACSDIRKEFTPTTYQERWTPSLRGDSSALFDSTASSSTDVILRSVPRDDRSRSPPIRRRGISGAYKGDDGETVEFWKARPRR
jgi:hypothetical protein